MTAIRMVSAAILGIAVCLLSVACVRLPFYSFRNAELGTHQRTDLPRTDLPPGEIGRSRTEPAVANDAGLAEPELFIGLAISGGGSRAANFGAAVLQQLHELDLLRYVKAMSSVSGGSLPAAYFVLHPNTSIEGWDTFRSKMRYKFLHDWGFRVFTPLTVFRKLFTDYDRTDHLASVFDRVLFRSATFGMLRSSAPELLINATDLSSRRFTFDRHHFERLGSSLDTYPIALAVAASGAFPGLFDNVTLRDYRAEPPRYVHVFDGGGADNLGIQALIEAASRHLESREAAPPPCLLIIADAHVDAPDSDSDRRDTRRWYDLVINLNALTAVDALLRTRRAEQLRAYQLAGDLGTVLIGRKGQFTCKIWHLTFARLPSVAVQSITLHGGPDASGGMAKVEKYHATLTKIIDEIRTSYKLDDSRGCSGEALQVALYDAARILVRDDAALLTRALKHLNVGRDVKREFLYRARPEAEDEGNRCPAVLKAPEAKYRLGPTR